MLELQGVTALVIAVVADSDNEVIISTPICEADSLPLNFWAVWTGDVTTCPDQVP